MCLRPNAIVLVFHKCILEIAERLFGRFRRARQHEAERMKQSHLRLSELSRRRQFQRLTNIAEQHVRALHLGQSASIRFCDRFFDQAFF